MITGLLVVLSFDIQTCSASLGAKEPWPSFCHRDSNTLYSSRNALTFRDRPHRDHRGMAITESECGQKELFSLRCRALICDFDEVIY